MAVWAWPIRLIHWGLAALVLFNLFNDSGGQTHRYAGYAAAALVAMRTGYALFRRDGPAAIHWPGPLSCMTHLRLMLAGKPPRTVGHNPLGMAMAILLWSLVLLLALTGWISRWDRFWGEDWPVDLHGWIATALQVAVVAHLLGVIVSSVLERRNLVLAMITGRKTVDS